MIPLIITSIITGIISNSSDQLRSLGSLLLLYFLGTTTAAITIGVLMAELFKPGEYVRERGGLTSDGTEAPMPTVNEESQSLPDTISGLIPVNPLEAMITGEMLGIVIYTIIIGIAITQISTELARPIIRVSEAIQKICITVVGWAMRLVPYAVFGMMASLMATIGYEVLIGLGYYMAVVVIGLIILLLFYWVILYVFTQRKPLAFMGAV